MNMWNKVYMGRILGVTYEHNIIIGNLRFMSFSLISDAHITQTSKVNEESSDFFQLFKVRLTIHHCIAYHPHIIHT